MQRLSHLKISGIIFPMVLTLLMLPMEANAYSAGYEFEYGGLRYTVLNEPANTVACSGCSNGGGDIVIIVIPAKVNIGGITYTVVRIDDFAFSDCSSLTSISIPDSITTIGEGAFYCCFGLTSITIPNSVTTIGESAFSYCFGLTSISIPNSVTTIESSAFSDCISLTSITIPNSVTTIGDHAFSNCSSLTSISIPNSVTTIGDHAFSYCSSLTSVYYPADDPIESTADVFYYSYSDHTSIYNNATLYVPANAVNKCKQIDPWKNFKSIEAYDFAGVDDISVDAGADFPCEVYNINGVKIAKSTDNLAPGIYIVRQGSNVKKIIVN